MSPHLQYVDHPARPGEPTAMLSVFLATAEVFSQMDLLALGDDVADQLARLDQ